MSVLQGSSRLSLQDEVGRPAAAADGATAAMEEGDLHAVFLAHLQQVFHGTVQLPGGGELACILHRVGIAQHDLLLSLDMVPVPRHAQRRIDDLGRVDQVLARLEERRHAHHLLHTSNLLQQAHGQDVRSGARHGDDIGTQGFARQLRNDLVGVQDLLDDVAHGHVRGQQGALGLDLLHQPVASLLLGPFGELSQAQEAGQGVHDLRVTIGFLTHIQACHADAEGAHAADQVQQTSVGHDLVALLNQRAVHDFQRTRQLLSGGNHLLLEIRIVLLAHVQGLHGDLGTPASATDGHEQTAVGLVLGHAGVEVPVHSAAGVGFADLGAWCRSGPHGAHGIHLGPHFLVDFSIHTELIQQLIHLTVVQLHHAPAQQRHHLLGHLPGHIGIAIAVSTHPATHLQNGGVEGQRRGTDAGQASVQAAVVLRHGLPHGLLNDQHAVAGLAFRGGARAAHGVGAPATPLDGLDLVVEAGQLSRGQLFFTIVHLHLLQHLLVLLQGTTSLRFRGMRRQDQLDLLVDDGLANIGWLDSLLDQFLEGSNEAHHGGVLRVGDALHLRRHGVLEGAQTMMGLRQACLHQNLLEHAA
mmetsp:Transcript_77251/g.121576  ORF Transcript_77251/g.121576 Transcript_77251/m.121576 type:complete len:583 (+) Transcript_77251:880-2628(+)